jgi:hypothetical protein
MMSRASQPITLSKVLRVLSRKFDAHEQNELRARDAVWSFLGFVYAMDDLIARDKKLKGDLIATANIQIKSNRWRADKKKPAEILLTLKLGLNDQTAATKSQWLKAIRAAKKAGVGPSEKTFFNWLKKQGGINAINTAKKIKKGRGTKSGDRLDIRAFTKQKLPKLLSSANETVKLDIAPDQRLQNVTLVLLHQGIDDETGRSDDAAKVIYKTADEKLLASVVAALASAS